MQGLFDWCWEVACRNGGGGGGAVIAGCSAPPGVQEQGEGSAAAACRPRRRRVTRALTTITTSTYAMCRAILLFLHEFFACISQADPRYIVAVLFYE